MSGTVGFEGVKAFKVEEYVGEAGTGWITVADGQYVRSDVTAESITGLECFGKET